MTTELARTIEDVRQTLAPVRRMGRRIGLVPTMGGLHAGHGVLIDRARLECDYVVVSVFVNPIQFDRPEDFEAYRISLDSDLAFCGARGADVVFAPSAAEMYLPDRSTYVEVARISEHLCGAFRPGHFRGVATVVAKLFNIVAPDVAYFGEKDAQQLALLQRMVLDLDFPIEIVPVPTVREPDGLALSSRNRRLTPEERAVAPTLYNALKTGQERVAAGARSAAEVEQAVLACLAPQMRPEYVEVVDPKTMTPVDEITGAVRIAAAVWLGNTRLIDNVYCE